MRALTGTGPLVRVLYRAAYLSLCAERAHIYPQMAT